jgi:hypothetical protein
MAGFIRETNKENVDDTHTPTFSKMYKKCRTRYKTIISRNVHNEALEHVLRQSLLKPG